ncbi:hypothetical protein GCM10010517_09190 [Streptosporangium fragile]|uniref:Uncharacterized protein n=1 Tax=Streptosporangium fragile TaxID=46186 RepID=A0ABN3VS45_9ACTN
MKGLGRTHDAAAPGDLVKHAQAPGIDIHAAQLMLRLRKVNLHFSDGSGNHNRMLSFTTGG